MDNGKGYISASIAPLENMKCPLLFGLNYSFVDIMLIIPGCLKMYLFHGARSGMAQLVERATLDLRIVNLSFTLQVEIT